MVTTLIYTGGLLLQIQKQSSYPLAWVGLKKEKNKKLISRGHPLHDAIKDQTFHYFV